jgi:hypothetical protein
MHLWWGGGGVEEEQVHTVDYDPVKIVGPSLDAI